MSFLRRLLGRDDREAMDVWTEQVPTVPQHAAPQHGDLVLVDAGPRKIEVIKVVREATGLGLKEAKDLVESAPVPIDSGWDAAELRRRLADAGAQVS